MTWNSWIDTFTGPDGAAWNSGLWTPNAGASGTRDIQGDRGRMLFQSTANARVTAVSRIGQLTDLEILFSFQFTTNGGTGCLRIGFRSDGTFITSGGDIGIPQNGYCLSMYSNGSDMELDQFAASVQTPLDTASHSAHTNLQWCRINMVGTGIEVRVWDDGSAEPGTPTMSATDSTYATGLAQVAWGRAGSSIEIKIDDFLIARELTEPTGHGLYTGGSFAPISDLPISDLPSTGATGVDIDTDGAHLAIRAATTSLDLDGLVVDTTAGHLHARAATTTVAAAETEVDTNAGHLHARGGDTSIVLGGAEVDTDAARIHVRAAETRVSIPGCGVNVVGLQLGAVKEGLYAHTSWGAFGPGWLWIQPCTVGAQPVTIDTDGGHIHVRAGETSLALGELEVDTDAARLWTRGGTTSIDTDATEIDTTGAHLRLRAGDTTLLLGDVEVDTDGARLRLRVADTSVVIGAANVDTDGGHMRTRAGDTTLHLGTLITTTGGHLGTRAGATSVQGGSIFIPDVECDITMLPVACDITTLPVSCDLSSLLVECEVLN